jgi:hypothetical protein
MARKPYPGERPANWSAPESGSDGSGGKPRSWVKIGCLGIVGLFGGVIALGAFIQAVDPEGTARRAQEAEAAQAAEAAAEADQQRAERLAAIGSAMKVTSLQLSAAYQENEVAAQSAFEGRAVLVTGKVTGVALDLMDNPVVSLESVNEFLSVQASLSDKNAAASLRKGDEIQLLCQKVTEVISAPQLDECIIVE